MVVCALTIKKVASEFNNHFISVADVINSDMPLSSIDPLLYLGPRNEHSFFISPSCDKEVDCIISSFVTKGGTL